LIDERLSVDLVSVAGRAGHDAQHIAHIGRAGWKDWNVVRYARAGDFVLVTNKRAIFAVSTPRRRCMPASSS
jgi:predicted nuclease of predicted toxin-antitoxin system